MSPVEKTTLFVKTHLKNAEGGHDWWHIYRVWNNARHIASGENVNMLVIELSALLHDIADSKFYNGDETVGPRRAREFLNSLEINNDDIEHIIKIIDNISFKGGTSKSNFFSPEFAIVQDADRLDAIGAIGIARTFNYGGFKNRELYNPEIQPNLNMSREEYKNSSAPTLNHFYEKLLLLKDRMKTPKGKMIAQERHVFMEQYLEHFYKEWNGEW
jgi:uncharacterized protein